VEYSLFDLENGKEERAKTNPLPHGFILEKP
jgi:hypothetical protein